MNKAKRREQTLKFGDGYSRGRYCLTKSVIEDVDSESDVQDDSEKDNWDFLHPGQVSLLIISITSISV